MSTITKELAKLFRKITNSEIDAEGNAHVVLSPADSLLINNARIALASLEAEAVACIDRANLDYLESGADADVWPASGAGSDDVLLYAAPQLPQPAVVSDEMIDTFEAEFRRAFEVSPEVEQMLEIGYQGEKFSFSIRDAATWWKLGRAAMLKHSAPFIVTSDHRMMEMPKDEDIDDVAAMLQAGNHTEQHLDMVDHFVDASEKGKDGTLINESTMPATQIKPVADLYGITSPTGSETTFTFDAGEASSFAKGGWTVQEYVELERYQEAVAGNSPVTPDCLIPVSERMPPEGTPLLVCSGNGVVQRTVYGFDGENWLDWYEQYDPVKAEPDDLWQPLPAAPKEVG